MCHDYLWQNDTAELGVFYSFNMGYIFFTTFFNKSYSSTMVL